MNKKSVSKERPTLARVQKQFEMWRSTRRKREPIPEQLWEAAAALTKQVSITEVCRVLRLEFNELKRRAHIRRKTGGREVGPQFIEFSLPACDRETYVEFEDKNQNKMKVYSKGEADYKDLAKIFWEKTV